MDLLAWLRLALSPELSNGNRLALIAAFERPERAFAASRREVVSLVGEPIARSMEKQPETAKIDVAIKWLEEPNRHLVVLNEPQYPGALKQIPDPPVALYVQGRLDLLNAPAFAIVGSRNATVQGARDAESFAETLSGNGLTIVSGLALGIDAAAHQGGLRARGSSIAIVGTGADRIYPPRNRDLAHRLAAEGALVSEFPLGTPPLRENFPQRNRLISGLALGVLVVEAAMQSGSLITARFALEQNRDVFAIPGSIHSPVSKGCNALIKEGAKLVEGAEDILEELHFEYAPVSKSRPARAEPPDDLLEAMGHSPISVDEMAQRTGESASSIAAHLSVLEIEGRVALVAGGLFQRLEAR